MRNVSACPLFELRISGILGQKMMCYYLVDALQRKVGEPVTLTANVKRH